MSEHQSFFSTKMSEKVSLKKLLFYEIELTKKFHSHFNFNFVLFYLISGIIE